ncbi:MAG: hypothetical protein RL701_4790, partial [Pseudomonadota bacterium]
VGPRTAIHPVGVGKRCCPAASPGSLANAASTSRADNLGMEQIDIEFDELGQGVIVRVGELVIVADPIGTWVVCRGQVLARVRMPSQRGSNTGGAANLVGTGNSQDSSLAQRIRCRGLGTYRPSADRSRRRRHAPQRAYGARPRISPQDARDCRAPKTSFQRKC